MEDVEAEEDVDDDADSCEDGELTLECLGMPDDDFADDDFFSRVEAAARAEEMDLAERIERGEAVPTPTPEPEDDEDEKALAALEADEDEKALAALEDDEDEKALAALGPEREWKEEEVRQRRERKKEEDEVWAAAAKAKQEEIAEQMKKAAEAEGVGTDDGGRGRRQRRRRGRQGFRRVADTRDGGVQGSRDHRAATRDAPGSQRNGRGGGRGGGARVLRRRGEEEGRG